MDILRRNTDYAIRAMVQLGKRFGREPVSSRELAEIENISAQLTSKLLQKLAKAGLVESSMGIHGGFSLSRDPSQISLGTIIEVIQGPVQVNRCICGDYSCSRQHACGVHDKLIELQHQMNDYLSQLTLADVVAESRQKEQSAKAGN